MAVPFALDLGPLFFEDVGLGNNLQLGSRQAKAFRQLSDGDVHGDIQQLVGTINQDAAEAVLLQQLGRAFSPSVPATNSTVSPRSRMRLTSAIHSWMRPRNSTAG